MKNTPYVKVYEKGILTNPIKGKYVSEFDNRITRRKKEVREFNNKKTYPINVVYLGRGKFYKSTKLKQIMPIGVNGKNKVITHHVEI